MRPPMPVPAAAALAACFCAFLAAGCVTLDAPFRAHLVSEAPQVRECAEWYRLLDERVAAAGVRDAQDASVRGFPYLRGSDSLARYEIRPYAELRSMPRLDGGRAGVFGPDGLVPGTERAERFVFWPMGIASAGAMRQWGRHATAFVGRRHFDDADLFEKRFRFDLR